MIELSKRLTAIVQMVEKDDTIADVGCDHGYASISLIQNGIVNHVFAMDVKSGPLEIAKKNVKTFGLEKQIELRLSDGLQKLDVGEAKGVVIAGMGGSLMVKILTDGCDKLLQMNQLILQPQSEVNLVRQYIRNQGFYIDYEDMILEEGKYYPMFHAKRIDGSLITEHMNQALFDYYGELALKGKHPVLREFLTKEYNVTKSVIEKLIQESTDRFQVQNERKEKRLQELNNKLTRIKLALTFFE